MQHVYVAVAVVAEVVGTTALKMNVSITELIMATIVAQANPHHSIT